MGGAGALHWHVSGRYTKTLVLKVSVNQTAVSPTNPIEGYLEAIEQCVNQLTEAGFGNIQTAIEELGYYYPNLDAYWEEDVMSSMRRIPLDKLDPAKAEQVRGEHLEEMKIFARDQGIWRPVPTLLP